MRNSKRFLALFVLLAFLLIPINSIQGQTNAVTLMASAQKTTDGNTHTNSINVIAFKEGIFFMEVTAASGTTPTLDVDIESYDPYTDDWYVVSSFAQVTTTGNYTLKIPECLGQSISIKWTLGGTTPDFTFSVSGILKR